MNKTLPFVFTLFDCYSPKDMSLLRTVWIPVVALLVCTATRLLLIPPQGLQVSPFYMLVDLKEQKGYFITKQSFIGGI